MKRAGNRSISLAIGLTVLLVAAVVWREPVLGHIGAFLDVAAAPQPVDYVLVLPGGPETRPFLAAAMVRSGLAQRVLVPGAVDSPKPLNGLVAPCHELTKRTLNARGVSDDRILAIEFCSSSTWEDAQALARFLKREPGATVAVVTNDLHTRRVRWVLRKTLGAAARQVSVLAAPLDEFGPRNWWHSRRGVEQYAAEYAKLTYYWVRYGDPVAWSCIVVVILLCLGRRFGGIANSQLRV